MNQPESEADARIEIDELLRQAGWDPADKSMVGTEIHSAADDGSHSRADYVLYDQRGRPLAVIEAKKNAIDPYVAKQQALPYAQSLGAPFIFLANGELTYFWDYQNDDARQITGFFSRRDLERLVEMRATRKPLATVEIPEHYIRQGETRTVRPYQAEAMRSLDHGFELGKRRFLIELPTGTGKTDLICLYLKRLLQAGWVEKVLFLVDRDQLALQALEAIQDILSSYPSFWLRPGSARQEQQITVALLQTMIGRVDEYTAGYFDIVIADECHRSIYGAWQAALTRFDTIHIGLTATPASYIERNTYDLYQCEPGTPDVGMLDTGFDCREILHLVLCRRVRSPILYQQMRGRGTRTAPHIQKRKFVIYDFFRNHQYFNDSDTDVYTGTGGIRGTAIRERPPDAARELIELGLDDEWLQAVTYIEIGPNGERVDKREYVTHWEETIRARTNDDPLLRKVSDGESLEPDEEDELARRLNCPERYFNEDNLRRAYRDPGGNLIDFIRAALGRLRIKSHEEKLEEIFRAWLVTRSLTPRQAEYLCLLKNRGVATGHVRLEDLFEPPLSMLDVASKGVELFGEEGLKQGGGATQRGCLRGSRVKG